MKKYIYSLVLIGILAGLLNAADRKLAQTGMKFLSTSLDARVTALGEAFTAAEGYSTMMFYNPAGMAFMDRNFHGAFGRVEFDSSDFCGNPIATHQSISSILGMSYGLRCIAKLSL